MSFKDDKPPTSKEEAYARRKRPPPEKYDPDNRSHWSITETLAWIIWRDLDAVRNECDSYREKCADWKLDPDATARAKLVIPEIQKDLQESPWHLQQWELSGWNLLCLKAIRENVLEPRQRALRPPQVAIDELWQAAGEDRIKATALQYENAKALLGDPIEIPDHYWPYLKCTDDPLTGKAMLTDDQGRVYREVKFRQLDVKRLWPKAPPLSEEHAETWPSHLALIQLTESTMWSGLFSPPCAYSDSHRSEVDALEHVEKPEPEQTRPAELEPKEPKKEPKKWLDWARKERPKQKNERSTPYIRHLHGLMKEADNVTKVWGYENFRRRYYEAVKAERQAVQKKRKSPRTV